MNRTVYFSFLALISCHSDKIETVVPTNAYTGLEVGHWCIYKVTDITYTVDIDLKGVGYLIQGDTIYYTGVGIDTSRYYIKELIYDITTDLEGDEAYVVHRYYNYSNDTFAFNSYPDSLWTAKVKNRVFLRNENNTVYTKLSLPLYPGKQWDINALNTEKEKIVTIKKMNQKMEFDDLSFENTACIEEEYQFEKQSDTVYWHSDRKVKYEIYDQSVGLIYKYNLKLGNCEKQIEDSIGNTSYIPCEPYKFLIGTDNGVGKHYEMQIIAYN